MAFKELLVHVDDTSPCEIRLELAARLARDHDAHLIGLHVTPRYDIPSYVRVRLPTEAWATQDQARRAAEEEAEARFREQTTLARVAAEWRSDVGNPADITVRHARCADLTIVGQADPNDPEGAAWRGVAEEILLGAGRPVLVVPYAGRFAAVGRRVMVAWNASREAARAVNDALPILQPADQVVVLTVTSPGGPGADPSGAALARHLARHGVSAEATHVDTSEIDVGDMLLSRAADGAVDLIVMGGYGRSRLRELVLGGTTRHLFNHMTVPVFISH